jgi:hypothetical protein
MLSKGVEQWIDRSLDTKDFRTNTYGEYTDVTWNKGENFQEPTVSRKSPNEKYHLKNF